jgi:acyl phosphate:glycerol-3-phosphate acyltransferase
LALDVAAAVLAYLLGSIPFGYLLVRIFLKQDIRETGSGNIGATNVARSGAKGLAIATLLLDAGKGTAAAWLGWYLHSVPILVDVEEAFRFACITSLCAIAGHMFPVWLKFRGGKGVATAVGAFAFLAPKPVLVAVAVFLIVLALTRYVSLGSVCAAIVFPIAVWLLPPIIAGESPVSPAVLGILSLCSALIIFKHHQNLRRILAGTENKLGSKPIPPPQQLEKQA